MTKNEFENSISQENFQNLLEQNPKLGEAFRYLQSNAQISENRFLVYTDSNIDQLEEWELVKYGTGGQLMVLDRVNNGYFFLSNNPEKAQEVVKKALEELKEVGYQVPFNLDSQNLVYELANHRSWLNQVNREVWYGNTERARKVDLDVFRHLQVVNKGKPVYLGKEAKRLIDKAEGFEQEYSSDFLESFDKIQREAGIYTAITRAKMPFYRWVYDIIRSHKLNEREIELIIQEVEEKLEKGDITEKDLRNAIKKYESRKEEEETNE